MEGCGHGPLDYHVLIKAFFDLQVSVTERLKIGFKKKRRLVGGPGFEKMRGVALNMIFSITDSNCHARC